MLYIHMVAPAIDLALCSVLILLFDHCYRYWIFQLTVNGAVADNNSKLQ